MKNLKKIIKNKKISDEELVIQIILSMEKSYPEKIISLLTKEQIENLKKKVANPPASLDKIGIFIKAEEKNDKDRQIYFDGLWQWHYYFKNREQIWKN